MVFTVNIYLGLFYRRAVSLQDVCIQIKIVLWIQYWSQIHNVYTIISNTIIPSYSTFTQACSLCVSHLALVFLAFWSSCTSCVAAMRSWATFTICLMANPGTHATAITNARGLPPAVPARRRGSSIRWVERYDGPMKQLCTTLAVQQMFFNRNPMILSRGVQKPTYRIWQGL